jgi:NADPH-dependent 2,4-dienoyl-CoA reductase/sulfur reductase-like enzyme
VIVGGGYIGIEMAEALLDRNLEVSLIDMASQVMNTMDPDMTDGIVQTMREAGIDVFLARSPARYRDGVGRPRTQITTDQRRLDADLVILGLGIRPSSELAKAAGIALGGRRDSRGRQMRTSTPHIWAAGDCAESFHIVKEEPAFVALGTVANKHGLVAGTNLSGGEAEFPGVLGTAITRFRIWRSRGPASPKGRPAPWASHRARRPSTR